MEPFMQSYKTFNFLFFEKLKTSNKSMYVMWKYSYIDYFVQVPKIAFMTYNL